MQKDGCVGMRLIFTAFLCGVNATVALGSITEVKGGPLSSPKVVHTRFGGAGVAPTPFAGCLQPQCQGGRAVGRVGLLNGQPFIRVLSHRMAATSVSKWVQVLLAVPPDVGYSPPDCKSLKWRLSALVLLFWCVWVVFVVGGGQISSVLAHWYFFFGVFGLCLLLVVAKSAL